jgi:hypothetical protein
MYGILSLIRRIFTIFDKLTEKHESVVYSCSANLGNSKLRHIYSQGYPRTGTDKYTQHHAFALWYISL